jgi:hypothetical protein
MSIEDVVVPLIGILGTAGIWQYLQFRQKFKLEEKKFKNETSTDTMYRDDLKSRVKNLEALLAVSSQEKDEMREEIKVLVAEVSKIRVEVEYLKKENDRLKDRR